MATTGPIATAIAMLLKIGADYDGDDVATAALEESKI